METQSNCVIKLFVMNLEIYVQPDEKSSKGIQIENILQHARHYKPWLLQLNKYQTDLYLLELSHQMTNVCLLISDFLPAFDCSCSLGT